MSRSEDLGQKVPQAVKLEPPQVRPPGVAGPLRCEGRVCRRVEVSELIRPVGQVRAAQDAAPVLISGEPEHEINPDQ